MLISAIFIRGASEFEVSVMKLRSCTRRSVLELCDEGKECCEDLKD